MYTYSGTIVEVYDADSMTVDFDLGFGIHLKGQKVRLLGVDTPELRTKNLGEKKLGYEARDYVRGLILGKQLIVKTYKGDKKGKFGRWLVDIEFDDGKILSNDLITKGHAVEYWGEKKTKVWA